LQRFQSIHWIGFLLDEIFFRGYRRVEIREPLFVLGVPRSGTTHLHRLIAKDESLTTFSTWECLFAPSVTQRCFWLALGRVDAMLGRPLGRLLGFIEQRAFKELDAVHPMRLGDPEEDYFALMPALASFILILPFPHSDLLWRMGTFDRDMPASKRKRLMDFYAGCLQRHLYVRGRDKRLLSKNAAFAPLAGSLAERFPDARFIVCLREPEATLPSQLSSLEAGIGFFGVRSVVPDFGKRLTDQLSFYYDNLETALAHLPHDRCAWISMRTLKSDPVHPILTVYRQLGLPISEAFRAAIGRAAAEARDYRSPHKYSLEGFGLCRESIDRDLGPLYARLAARALQSDSHPPSMEARKGDESMGLPSTGMPGRHYASIDWRDRQ
jgi:omega-hydroxy-beta-dihydromenaquinone-9 sulfotransferase